MEETANNGSDDDAHPGLEKLLGRAARTKGQEAKYFSVRTACVKCRKPLSVRGDLLHAKLKCPHCGTKLHIGTDGVWREGVRKTPEREDDFRSIDEDFRTPPWWQQTAAGRFLIAHHRRVRLIALGVMLIAITAVLVRNAALPALPESLDDRTSLLARSIVDGDDFTFSRLVADGAADEAKSWVRRVRGQLRGESGVSWSVEVTFSSLKEGRAVTSIRYSTPEKVLREVVVYWKLDRQNLWRVDGEKSLAAK